MLRYALLFSFLMTLLAGQGEAQDSECIYTANRPATVHIEYKYTTQSDGTGTETGTGFIISRMGHVITNAHVVSSRLKNVTVTSSTITVLVGGLLNPRPVGARELTRDPSIDLALLQLDPRPEGGEWSTVRVGNSSNFAVGAPLIGLGFGSSGDIAIVPPGQKTAQNTIVDGVMKPWWQTNLSLNPGNSGGPIFGQLGTVVGIAVAKNDAAQLVTYVIPINFAQHLLDAANVQSQQAALCAVFPQCEHPSHGIDKYAIDETKNGWSGWRRGGYNRGAYCNDLLQQLQASYPASTFTFLRDDEQVRDVGIRAIEYRYYCEFRRRETPIYVSKRSIACVK